jgi:hypothetical protein
MSANLASFKNGVLTVTTDIRFPATHNKEEIIDALTNAGANVNVANYQAPLYNNPNGAMISTLMKVYNKALGVNAQPIAIGGGTYARALECGCAFGPEINGEEQTIHQANEYVTFERIELLSEIYYNAIKAIAIPPKYIKIGTITVKIKRTRENSEKNFESEKTVLGMVIGFEKSEEVVAEEIVEEPVEETTTEETQTESDAPVQEECVLATE